MIPLIASLSDILIESVVGILVVFIALSLLVVAFKIVGKIIRYYNKKKLQKLGQANEQTEELTICDAAAVSFALHLFLNELHDEESDVITIKRIERRYSPWSSKIYGLNSTK